MQPEEQHGVSHETRAEYTGDRLRDAYEAKRADAMHAVSVGPR